MVITEEFLNRVRFLCRNISKEEWSGILWYDIEGSIKDPENMTITPREILLMDIGTKVHTEYKFTSEVQKFIMSKNLMLCKYGHIHSHNSMGVYFSGEDDAELNDNCLNHNYYVSLIVNNYMEMIAKVVFKGQVVSFVCPDEDGEAYDLSVEGLNPTMLVYDCDIVKDTPDLVVSNDFEERLYEIEKRTAEAARKKAEDAKRAAAQAAAKKGTPTPNPALPAVTKPAQPVSTAAKWGEPEFDEGNKGQKLSDSFEGDAREITEFDPFICYVFRAAEDVKGDTVDKALFQANYTFTTGGGAVVDSIMENYPTYYDNFFDTETEGFDPEHFMDTLEELIAICELNDKTYVWLGTLSTGLRMMGNKFEAYHFKTQD